MVRELKGLVKRNLKSRRSRGGAEEELEEPPEELNKRKSLPENLVEAIKRKAQAKVESFINGIKSYNDLKLACKSIGIKGLNRGKGPLRQDLSDKMIEQEMAKELEKAMLREMEKATEGYESPDADASFYDGNFVSI